MSLCLLRVIPQRFLNSVWPRVSDDDWRVIQHLRPGPSAPYLPDRHSLSLCPLSHHLLLPCPCLGGILGISTKPLTTGPLCWGGSNTRHIYCMSYRSHMHRPCLSVFGNSNHARTVFGLTMVTGYPGKSGPLWPGELVIRSTITYGGGSGIDKSMVVRWAYIKELAVTNTREKGIGIITSYMGGRHSKG